MAVIDLVPVRDPAGIWHRKKVRRANSGMVVVRRAKIGTKKPCNAYVTRLLKVRSTGLEEEKAQFTLFYRILHCPFV